MNAVGIDVSKGRSTVTILRPFGEVVQAPVDVMHDAVSLENLAYKILELDGETKVLMGATGRYHEPIAAELHEHGIFVSVVNPLHGIMRDKKTTLCLSLRAPLWRTAIRSPSCSFMRCRGYGSPRRFAPRDDAAPEQHLRLRHDAFVGKQ